MSTPKTLFEENTKLVYYCAKKLKIPAAHYEDVIQEGMLELWRVAQKFKPEFGYAFSTYAIPNIIGVMKKYCRDKISIIGIPRTVWDGKEELDLQISSLDFLLEPEDGHSAALGDFIPAAPDFYETLFEDNIEDFLDTLPEGRYKNVAEEVIYGSAYGELPSQKELADKYQLNQSSISRYMIRARKDFKRFLANLK